MDLIKVAHKIQAAIKKSCGIDVPVSLLSKGTRFNPNKIPHILISVPSFEEAELSGGTLGRKYILSVRVASDGEDSSFCLAEAVADSIAYCMPMCGDQMIAWRLMSAESETFLDADSKVSVFHMVFSGEYFKQPLRSQVET